MARAVEVTRRDRSSKDLRKMSGRMRTPEATCRTLAIANVLDGMSREMAARLAGLDRQSLRDWVHRYNAEGAEGLYDRQAPGKGSRLDAEQKTQLREIVLKGPDPAKDGIVRWRCCDLQELIGQEYGVSYHERYIGRLLRRLGLSYITGRPRHAKGDPQKQEEFKKTSRRSLRKPSPNTPETKRSKSGSKMKRASGRKVG